MSTTPTRQPTFLELLDDRDRTGLLALGRTINAPSGSALMFQGEPGDRVMILLVGHAKVARTTDTGHETLLSICDPGDLLGELAHIDSRPRTATVTALGQVEALIIASSTFRAHTKRAPGIGSAMLEVLATRCRDTTQWSTTLAHSDTLGRLAARLTELAERYGQPTELGLTISLAVSQQELTAWIGASRASVANALLTLRQLGWIQTQRRQIVLQDIEALRARAA
jgi:CRP/FNR family transcriptional regulator, cyclic AMP receptor protein